MNKLLFIFLVFFSFVASVFAQNRTIDFFINPYMQKFGNINKQNTLLSSQHFDVDYRKVPSFNFGISVHFNEKEKNYFSFALFHQNNFYQMKMNVFSPTTPQPKDNSKYNEFRKISTQNIGFNIFYSKLVTTNITLRGGFSFIFPYYTTSNLENIDRTTIGIGGIIGGAQYQTYRFDYKITQEKFLPQLFIPEIQLKVKMTDNFYFNLGTQLQFFEIYKPGYINITANGFIGNENSDQYNRIYESRLKNTNLNFYFGVTYALK